VIFSDLPELCADRHMRRKTTPKKTERDLPGVRVSPETAVPSVLEKENVS
jgi:hypothetical protein